MSALGEITGALVAGLVTAGKDELYVQGLRGSAKAARSGAQGLRRAADHLEYSALFLDAEASARPEFTPANLTRAVRGVLRGRQGG